MNNDNPRYLKQILIAIIILIWSLIYLPGLGELELHGDENKRLEPALTMLRTGDYIMPQLAGKQYLAKPPLEYWLIAASVYVTGENSERAARLPSAMLILLFVLIIMLIPNSVIPMDGRFIISVMFMTIVGAITRGRACEIEALYTVLTGLVIWLWINWEENLSKGDWRASLIIGGILGLGLLAKGPLILLFFLIPVIIFLFNEGRIKELRSREYILILIISLLIFLCWALPVYLNVPVHNEHKVTSTWSVQMFSRLNPSSFHFLKWFKEVLGAFINFIPWIVILPLILKKGSTTIVRNSKWRACLYGTIVAFVLVNLMPDVRGRYTIPLTSSFCILTGWAINSWNYENLFDRIFEKINIILLTTIIVTVGIALILFPTGWIYKILPILLNGQTTPPAENNILASLLLLFAIISITIILMRVYLKRLPPKLKVFAKFGILTGVAMLSFFFIIASVLKPFDRKREFGKSLTKLIPENTLLYSYCSIGELGYHPFNYYIKRPMKYVYGVDDLYKIPINSYALIELKKYNHLLENKNFRVKNPYILDTIKYKKRERVLLKFTKTESSIINKN